MSKRYFMIVMALLAANAGCSTFRRGEVATQPDWSSRRPNLKRVAVLQPLCSDKESISDDSRTEIWQAAKESFGKIEGTILVDSATLEKELGWNTGTPVSDYAIVAAARSLGVDTVCVTTFHEYISLFLLGVCSADSSNRISYDMRLLDVATGQLLVQTHRSVVRHGMSLFRLQTELPSDLCADLAIVLSDKPALTNSDKSLAMNTNSRDK